MSVLVGTQTIEHLVPARPVDEHGWVDPSGFDRALPVTGTIQERIPGKDPEGNYGMWEPGQHRRGVAYIDTQCAPGDVLVADGIKWRVLDNRHVKDPRGTGELSCWVSQVEEVSLGGR